MNFDAVLSMPLPYDTYCSMWAYRTDMLKTTIAKTVSKGEICVPLQRHERRWATYEVQNNRQQATTSRVAK